MMTNEQLTDLLAEVTERILSVSDPDQIILFGSYARGEAGPDSDLDVLVVAPNIDAPRQESTRLRRALRGLKVPIDIIVTTPQQLRLHSSTPGMIYKPALLEGRLLYDRASSS